ncbi:MAG TPA: hypothetical protein VGM17_05910 [Rhizomicrobium sp.]|jgi:hypothetical protein
MKAIPMGVAAIFAGALCSAANAQVTYTDGALNGCYAHEVTSVDSGSAAVNRDGVGTTCFDGNGHILGSATSPHLSGGVSNTNGVIASHDDVTGTYKVTNSPGDGMGVFEGKCDKHAFVLRHIDSNGLAHGFSYILTTHKKGCTDKGPVVIGGSAEYQGPLQ